MANFFFSLILSHIFLLLVLVYLKAHKMLTRPKCSRKCVATDGQMNIMYIHSILSAFNRNKHEREREREAFFSSILFVVFIMATNVVWLIIWVTTNICHCAWWIWSADCLHRLTHREVWWYYVVREWQRTKQNKK